jgi:hypothetical protein
MRTGVVILQTGSRPDNVLEDTDMKRFETGFGWLRGGVFVVGLLSAASPAAADVVTDWNVSSVGFINAAARPAPAFMLDIAMVHVAIHDAVQAYQGRFSTYNAPILNAAGSPLAAVAAAAHDVLVSRFQLPSPNAGLIAQVDAAYASYLLGKGLAANDAGVAVGKQAAANIIARRVNDGAYPASPEIFNGGTGLSEWRDPRPMASPWMGNVTPFAQRDQDGLLHEPGPPQLTSGAYTKAYNEVKSLGRRTGSARTPQQTTMALFFSGNFLTIMEGVLRTVALARSTDIGDSARLFALANMASADAVINAWANKRAYNFWRPSTAIINGDWDGNPQTDGDAAWLPLIADPPYPDYTSGANSISGAVVRSLENFFGEDKYTFDVTSNALENGQPIAPRIYHSFSALADDVIDARILLGIHFRFADTVARRQAKHSADQAFAHELQPID